MFVPKGSIWYLKGTYYLKCAYLNLIGTEVNLLKSDSCVPLFLRVFRNYSNMLTLIITLMIIINVENKYFFVFQDSLMNRIFKRTTFI